MTLSPIFCDWSDETDTAETDYSREAPGASSMRCCLARLVQPWKSNRDRPQVVCSLYSTPLVSAPATTVTRVIENVLLNALAAVDAVHGVVHVTVRQEEAVGVLEVHASPVVPSQEIGLDIARTLVGAFDGTITSHGSGDGSTLSYRVEIPLAMGAEVAVAVDAPPAALVARHG